MKARCLFKKEKYFKMLVIFHIDLTDLNEENVWNYSGA